MHPIWGVHVHTNLGIPVSVSSGHNDHSARPLPPNRGPSALAPGGPNPPEPARRPFIQGTVAHPTNMHTRPFGCGRLPRSGATEHLVQPVEQDSMVGVSGGAGRLVLGSPVALPPGRFGLHHRCFAW